jgi:MarR family transcriptional regulator, organic hydroperoxide resistance regulator
MKRKNIEANGKKHRDIGIIVNSIRHINNQVQKQSQELRRSHNITGPQLGALIIISKTPDITLKVLSEKMYLHISTVSGIVDRLETTGHLSKIRDKNDHRAVNLQLTPKGTRLVKEVPLPVFGKAIKKLHKLPETQLREIGNAMAKLAKLMAIED